MLYQLSKVHSWQSQAHILSLMRYYVRMKKFTPFLVCSVVILWLFYGCGGSSDAVSQDPSSSPTIKQNNVVVEETQTPFPSVSSSVKGPVISLATPTSVPTLNPTEIPAPVVPQIIVRTPIPVSPTITPTADISESTPVNKPQKQIPDPPKPNVAAPHPDKPLVVTPFPQPNFFPLDGYSSFAESEINGFTSVMGEEFNAIYEKIGISASVYQNGKLWSDGLGFAKESVPMQGHTPVGIKSVSKTFLSALILSQIDQGLYGLDDRIFELLHGHSGFESLDKSVFPNVTVRELLTMTSGIATSDSNQTREAIEVMAGPEWVPASTLKLIKRSALPTGNFEYSPIANSFLLAMIAEYKTGENLYSLYRSALLNPLSIDAILMPDMIAPDSIAHPYGIRDYYGGSGGFGNLVEIPQWTKALCPNCFDDFSFINADARLAWSGAGVVTNSQNLSLWGYELFSTNGSALSESARETLLESFSDEVVQFTGPNPRYGFHAIKYKFVLSDGSELVAYGHPGGGSGTSSVLFYVPELELSISILSNSEIGHQPGNCKGARKDLLSALDCIGRGFMEVVSSGYVGPANESPGSVSKSGTEGADGILAGIKNIAVHNFIELGPYIAISKFRSAYGHDYSHSDEEYDASGKSCRSMKHYFDAYSYEQRDSGNFGTYDPKGIVKYYAPADGQLIDVDPNQFSSTETEYRFTIMSDANPDLFFTFMHVDLLEELRSGAKVKAGQHLGYIIRPHGQAEIATWIYLGNGQVKYISFFDVANDEVFAEYTERGIKDRAELIITKEDRDNNPIPCDRNDNSGGKFIATGDVKAFSDWQGSTENWVLLTQ